ncbi:MAG: hypothetical protein K2L24_02730, partial [Opitutales bacterium]|nr:hypothetical protein [Opitutales bacterium]
MAHVNYYLAKEYMDAAANVLVSDDTVVLREDAETGKSDACTSEDCKHSVSVINALQRQITHQTSFLLYQDQISANKDYNLRKILGSLFANSEQSESTGTGDVTESYVDRICEDLVKVGVGTILNVLNNQQRNEVMMESIDDTRQAADNALKAKLISAIDDYIGSVGDKEQGYSQENNWLRMYVKIPDQEVGKQIAALTQKAVEEGVIDADDADVVKAKVKEEIQNLYVTLLGDLTIETVRRYRLKAQLAAIEQHLKKLEAIQEGAQGAMAPTLTVGSDGIAVDASNYELYCNALKYVQSRLILAQNEAHSPVLFTESDIVDGKPLEQSNSNYQTVVNYLTESNTFKLENYVELALKEDLNNTIEQTMQTVLTEEAIRIALKKVTILEQQEDGTEKKRLLTLDEQEDVRYAMMGSFLNDLKTSIQRYVFDGISDDSRKIVGVSENVANGQTADLQIQDLVQVGVANFLAGGATEAEQKESALKYDFVPNVESERPAALKLRGHIEAVLDYILKFGPDRTDAKEASLLIKSIDGLITEETVVKAYRLQTEARLNMLRDIIGGVEMPNYNGTTIAAQGNNDLERLLEYLYAKILQDHYAPLIHNEFVQHTQNLTDWFAEGQQQRARSYTETVTKLRELRETYGEYYEAIQNFPYHGKSYLADRTTATYTRYPELTNQHDLFASFTQGDGDTGILNIEAFLDAYQRVYENYGRKCYGEFKKYSISDYSVELSALITKFGEQLVGSEEVSLWDSDDIFASALKEALQSEVIALKRELEAIDLYAEYERANKFRKELRLYLLEHEIEGWRQNQIKRQALINRVYRIAIDCGIMRLNADGTYTSGVESTATSEGEVEYNINAKSYKYVLSILDVLKNYSEDTDIEILVAEILNAVKAYKEADLYAEKELASQFRHLLKTTQNVPYTDGVSLFQYLTKYVSSKSIDFSLLTLYQKVYPAIMTTSTAPAGVQYLCNEIIDAAKEEIKTQAEKVLTNIGTLQSLMSDYLGIVAVQADTATQQELSIDEAMGKLIAGLQNSLVTVDLAIEAEGGSAKTANLLIESYNAIATAIQGLITNDTLQKLTTDEDAAEAFKDVCSQIENVRDSIQKKINGEGISASELGGNLSALQNALGDLVNILNHLEAAFFVTKENAIHANWYVDGVYDNKSQNIRYQIVKNIVDAYKLETDDPKDDSSYTVATSTIKESNNDAKIRKILQPLLIYLKDGVNTYDVVTQLGNLANGAQLLPLKGQGVQVDSWDSWTNLSEDVALEDFNLETIHGSAQSYSQLISNFDQLLYQLTTTDLSTLNATATSNNDSLAKKIGGLEYLTQLSWFNKEGIRNAPEGINENVYVTNKIIEAYNAMVDFTKVTKVEGNAGVEGEGEIPQTLLCIQDFLSEVQDYAKKTSPDQNAMAQLWTKFDQLQARWNGFITQIDGINAQVKEGIVIYASEAGEGGSVEEIKLSNKAAGSVSNAFSNMKKFAQRNRDLLLANVLALVYPKWTEDFSQLEGLQAKLREFVDDGTGSQNFSITGTQYRELVDLIDNAVHIDVLSPEQMTIDDSVDSIAHQVQQVKTEQPKYAIFDDQAIAQVADVKNVYQSFFIEEEAATATLAADDMTKSTVKHNLLLQIYSAIGQLVAGSEVPEATINRLNIGDDLLELSAFRAADSDSETTDIITFNANKNGYSRPYDRSRFLSVLLEQAYQKIYRYFFTEDKMSENTITNPAIIAYKAAWASDSDKVNTLISACKTFSEEVLKIVGTTSSSDGGVASGLHATLDALSNLLDKHGNTTEAISLAIENFDPEDIQTNQWSTILQNWGTGTDLTHNGLSYSVQKFYNVDPQGNNTTFFALQQDNNCLILSSEELAHWYDLVNAQIAIYEGSFRNAAMGVIAAANKDEQFKWEEHITYKSAGAFVQAIVGDTLVDDQLTDQLKRLTESAADLSPIAMFNGSYGYVNQQTLKGVRDNLDALYDVTVFHDIAEAEVFNDLSLNGPAPVEALAKKVDVTEDAENIEAAKTYFIALQRKELYDAYTQALETLVQSGSITSTAQAYNSATSTPSRADLQTKVTNVLKAVYDKIASQKNVCKLNSKLSLYVEGTTPSYGVESTETAKRAVNITIDQALFDAVQEVRNEYFLMCVQDLRREILSGAETVFNETDEGYTEGALRGLKQLLTNFEVQYDGNTKKLLFGSTEVNSAYILDEEAADPVMAAIQTQIGELETANKTKRIEAIDNQFLAAAAEEIGSAFAYNTWKGGKVTADGDSWEKFATDYASVYINAFNTAGLGASVGNTDWSSALWSADLKNNLKGELIKLIKADSANAVENLTGVKYYLLNQILDGKLSDFDDSDFEKLQTLLADFDTNAFPSLASSDMGTDNTIASCTVSGYLSSVAYTFPVAAEGGTTGTFTKSDAQDTGFQTELDSFIKGTNTSYVEEKVAGLWATDASPDPNDSLTQVEEVTISDEEKQTVVNIYQKGALTPLLDELAQQHAAQNYATITGTIANIATDPEYEPQNDIETKAKAFQEALDELVSLIDEAGYSATAPSAAQTACVNTLKAASDDLLAIEPEDLTKVGAFQLLTFKERSDSTYVESNKEGEFNCTSDENDAYVAAYQQAFQPELTDYLVHELFSGVYELVEDGVVDLPLADFQHLLKSICPEGHDLWGIEQAFQNLRDITNGVTSSSTTNEKADVIYRNISTALSAVETMLNAICLNKSAEGGFDAAWTRLQEVELKNFYLGEKSDEAEAAVATFTIDNVITELRGNKTISGTEETRPATLEEKVIADRLTAIKPFINALYELQGCKSGNFESALDSLQNYLGYQDVPSSMCSILNNLLGKGFSGSTTTSNEKLAEAIEGLEELKNAIEKLHILAVFEEQRGGEMDNPGALLDKQEKIDLRQFLFGVDTNGEAVNEGGIDVFRNDTTRNGLKTVLDALIANTGTDGQTKVLPSDLYADMITPFETLALESGALAALRDPVFQTVDRWNVLASAYGLLDNGERENTITEALHKIEKTLFANVDAEAESLETGFENIANLSRITSTTDADRAEDASFWQLTQAYNSTVEFLKNAYTQQGGTLKNTELLLKELVPADENNSSNNKAESLISNHNALIKAIEDQIAILESYRVTREEKNSTVTYTIRLTGMNGSGGRYELLESQAQQHDQYLTHLKESLYRFAASILFAGIARLYGASLTTEAVTILRDVLGHWTLGAEQEGLASKFLDTTISDGGLQQMLHKAYVTANEIGIQSPLDDVFAAQGDHGTASSTSLKELYDNMQSVFTSGSALAEEYIKNLNAWLSNFTSNFSTFASLDKTNAGAALKEISKVSWSGYFHDHGDSESGVTTERLLQSLETLNATLNEQTTQLSDAIANFQTAYTSNESDLLAKAEAIDDAFKAIILKLREVQNRDNPVVVLQRAGATDWQSGVQKVIDAVQEVRAQYAVASLNKVYNFTNGADREQLKEKYGMLLAPEGQEEIHELDLSKAIASAIQTLDDNYGQGETLIKCFVENTQGTGNISDEKLRSKLATTVNKTIGSEITANCSSLNTVTKAFTDLQKAFWKILNDQCTSDDFIKQLKELSQIPAQLVDGASNSSQAVQIYKDKLVKLYNFIRGKIASSDGSSEDSYFSGALLDFAGRLKSGIDSNTYYTTYRRTSNNDSVFTRLKDLINFAGILDRNENVKLSDSEAAGIGDFFKGLNMAFFLIFLQKKYPGWNSDENMLQKLKSEFYTFVKTGESVVQVAGDQKPLEGPEAIANDEILNSAYYTCGGTGNAKVQELYSKFMPYTGDLKIIDDNAYYCAYIPKPGEEDTNEKERLFVPLDIQAGWIYRIQDERNGIITFDVNQKNQYVKNNGNFYKLAENDVAFIQVSPEEHVRILMPNRRCNSNKEEVISSALPGSEADKKLFVLGENDVAYPLSKYKLLYKVYDGDYMSYVEPDAVEIAAAEGDQESGGTTEGEDVAGDTDVWKTYQDSIIYYAATKQGFAEVTDIPSEKNPGNDEKYYICADEGQYTVVDDIYTRYIYKIEKSVNGESEEGTYYQVVGSKLDGNGEVVSYYLEDGDKVDVVVNGKRLDIPLYYRSTQGDVKFFGMKLYQWGLETRYVHRNDDHLVLPVEYEKYVLASQVAEETDFTPSDEKRYSYSSITKRYTEIGNTENYYFEDVDSTTNEPIMRRIEFPNRRYAKNTASQEYLYVPHPETRYVEQGKLSSDAEYLYINNRFVEIRGNGENIEFTQNQNDIATSDYAAASDGGLYRIAPTQAQISETVQVDGGTTRTDIIKPQAVNVKTAAGNIAYANTDFILPAAAAGTATDQGLAISNWKPYRFQDVLSNDIFVQSHIKPGNVNSGYKLEVASSNLDEENNDFRAMSQVSAKVGNSAVYLKSADGQYHQCSPSDRDTVYYKNGNSYIVKESDKRYYKVADGAGDTYVRPSGDRNTYYKGQDSEGKGLYYVRGSEKIYGQSWKKNEKTGKKETVYYERANEKVYYKLGLLYFETTVDDTRHQLYFETKEKYEDPSATFIKTYYQPFKDAKNDIYVQDRNGNYHVKTDTIYFKAFDANYYTRLDDKVYFKCERDQYFENTGDITFYIKLSGDNTYYPQSSTYTFYSNPAPGVYQERDDDGVYYVHGEDGAYYDTGCVTLYEDADTSADLISDWYIEDVYEDTESGAKVVDFIKVPNTSGNANKLYVLNTDQMYEIKTIELGGSKTDKNGKTLVPGNRYIQLSEDSFVKVTDSDTRYVEVASEPVSKLRPEVAKLQCLERNGKHYVSIKSTSGGCVLKKQVDYFDPSGSGWRILIPEAENSTSGPYLAAKDGNYYAAKDIHVESDDGEAKLLKDIDVVSVAENGTVNYLGNAFDQKGQSNIYCQSSSGACFRVSDPMQQYEVRQDQSSGTYININNDYFNRSSDEITLKLKYSAADGQPTYRGVSNNDADVALYVYHTNDSKVALRKPTTLRPIVTKDDEGNDHILQTPLEILWYPKALAKKKGNFEITNTNMANYAYKAGSGYYSGQDFQLVVRKNGKLLPYVQREDLKSNTSVGSDTVYMAPYLIPSSVSDISTYDAEKAIKVTDYDIETGYFGVYTLEYENQDEMVTAASNQAKSLCFQGTDNIYYPASDLSVLADGDYQSFQGFAYSTKTQTSPQAITSDPSALYQFTPKSDPAINVDENTFVMAEDGNYHVTLGASVGGNGEGSCSRLSVGVNDGKNDATLIVGNYRLQAGNSEVSNPSARFYIKQSNLGNKIRAKIGNRQGTSYVDREDIRARAKGSTSAAEKVQSFVVVTENGEVEADLSKTYTCQTLSGGNPNYVKTGDGGYFSNRSKTQVDTDVGRYAPIDVAEVESDELANVTKYVRAETTGYFPVNEVKNSPNFIKLRDVYYLQDKENLDSYYVSGITLGELFYYGTKFDYIPLNKATPGDGLYYKYEGDFKSVLDDRYCTSNNARLKGNDGRL